MIPSEQELREAVKIVRKGRKEVTWDKDKADEYNKALDIVLSVNQQVLDCSEVVKKKKINEDPLSYSQDEDWDCGFNDCHDQFTQALVKRMMGMKDAYDKAEPSCKFCSATNQVKGFQAITTLITGEGE